MKFNRSTCSLWICIGAGRPLTRCSFFWFGFFFLLCLLTKQKGFECRRAIVLLTMLRRPPRWTSLNIASWRPTSPCQAAGWWRTIQQLPKERGALMTLKGHSGRDEFLMSVIVALVRPGRISCLSDTRKREKSDVFFFFFGSSETLGLSFWRFIVLHSGVTE